MIASDDVAVGRTEELGLGFMGGGEGIFHVEAILDAAAHDPVARDTVEVLGAGSEDGHSSKFARF